MIRLRKEIKTLSLPELQRGSHAGLGSLLLSIQTSSLLCLQSVRWAMRSVCSSGRRPLDGAVATCHWRPERFLPSLSAVFLVFGSSGYNRFTVWGAKMEESGEEWKGREVMGELREENRKKTRYCVKPGFHSSDTNWFQPIDIFLWCCIISCKCHVHISCVSEHWTATWIDYNFFRHSYKTLKK